ncbi:hypothetical protein Lal_00039395 [Lupinus albus]|nr:hypothetical protein Lal_00039395 [Lupinus albus]
MDDSFNWLSSIPLSPINSSLPPYLQESKAHNPFSLETSMDENMDSLFQNHDWNVINSHSCNEILDVEDFLGVRSSENHSDLVPLNDLDHLFTNNSLEVMPMENSLVAATNNGNYEYQENNANNNMQPLTLSTGNDGNKDSTNERSGDNNNTNNDVEVACRNSSQNSRQRKPKYRGVSRHVSTGRYEAHLWDNSVKREGKSKKGYQGGYDSEEKAARVYDLVALKYWGESATTNFPIGNYEKELEEMKNITKHDYVAAIRRKSSGFCRGASMYRGVTKHTKNGKWQAKMGRVGGEKDVYLGTYSTEEEAAKAYDIAAIKFRGPTAVTNFDINCYDVKSIIESNTLPLKGGAGKILEDSTEAVESSREREEMTSLLGSSSTSNVQGHGYPLQNQAMSCHNDTNQYPQFYNLSYVKTQLELYQKKQNDSNYGRLNNNQIQNDPTMPQGYMNIGSSSSSIMDNNGGGSIDWSYNGVGFTGNDNNNGLVGMTSNSSSSLMVNDGLVGMTSNSSSSLMDNNGGDSIDWSYDGVGFIGNNNNNGLVGMTSNSSSSLMVNNGLVGMTSNSSSSLMVNNDLVGMTPNSSSSLMDNNGDGSIDWSYNGVGFIRNNNNDLVGMTSNSSSSLMVNNGLVGMTSNSSSSLMDNNGGDSIDWSYIGVGFTKNNNNNGLVGTTSNSSSSLMVNNGLVGMTSNSSSSVMDNNGGGSIDWSYNEVGFIGNNNNDLVGMTSNSSLSLMVNNGLVGMTSNSSSSVMDNNDGGSIDWSYNGVGFIGNNNNGLVGMTSNSSSSLMTNNGLVGMTSYSSSSKAEDLSFMVDYDIGSNGYSGWLMDSINASNA